MNAPLSLLYWDAVECRLHKSDGMRCHEKIFSLPSTPLLFSHFNTILIVLIGLDKLHQFSSSGLPAWAQSSYIPSSLRAWSRFVLHQSSLYQMREREGGRERGRATGEFALCSIRPDLITGLPDYNDTPLNSRNCHCVSGAHRWISLLHHLVYACHSKPGRLSSLGRAKGNWPSIPDEREWPSTRVMIGNVMGVAHALARRARVEP